MKKLKIIQKEIKDFEARIFHHAVDLLLDETPTLKRFLNRNRDLDFILYGDDFEICKTPFVPILYKLLLATEIANDDLDELIENEDDDLPF